MILRGGVATKSESQQHQRISSISSIRASAALAASAHQQKQQNQQKVRKSAVLPTSLMSFFNCDLSPSQNYCTATWFMTVFHQRPKLFHSKYFELGKFSVFCQHMKYEAITKFHIQSVLNITQQHFSKLWFAALREGTG